MRIKLIDNEYILPLLGILVIPSVIGLTALLTGNSNNPKESERQVQPKEIERKKTESERTIISHPHYNHLSSQNGLDNYNNLTKSSLSKVLLYKHNTY